MGTKSWNLWVVYGQERSREASGNSRVRNDEGLTAQEAPFYVVQGRLSVVVLDRFRGMDIPDRFPRVVAFRVSLPFDQVLQGLVAPKEPVITDQLHLVFFFSVDKVRWWSGEVGAVCDGFAIGR